MNTNDIEAFVTVVEYKSYTRASTHLSLSPSALSRRIQSLEKSLQSQLLIRDSHGITLTQSGELFLKHAQAIVNKIGQATREIRSHQSEFSGELTVFSSLGMAKLVMPVVNDLSKNAPQMTVNWVLSEGRQAQLNRVVYDVMLHIDTPNDCEMIGQYLGDVELDFYASPMYLAQNGRIGTTDDIDRLGIIYSSADPDATKNWKLTIGGEVKIIELKPRYNVGSPELALELALSNHGIARLPKFLAEELVKQGKLALACIEPQQFSFAIYAIYPSREYLPKKSRLFIENVRLVLDKLGSSN
ncbi:LysR family transcriptional regulator [Vibrio wakamikoensis]|uniref:LysR family transcriptional regulator n=1 Tax=Vibrio wakamikoensis TaxID=2910251 RepID=UPI003D23ED35